jgi:hypothetical protein
MLRITIAIAIGTALVMGALMYGATKPLANQAFAATPCSLTIGNEGTTTISGKLECGGQGLGHATIHLTLHHITTGRTTTATAVTEIPDGSYDHAVVLGAGHSYTADAKYDGDSTHQPAFATTTVNIPASTGSTQQNNNTGNSQQSNNTGNSQQSNNANQASAATPCTLTLPVPENVPKGSVGEQLGTTLDGNLSCGGKGVGGATIKLSGNFPSSPEDTTTGDNGDYGQHIVISGGQSYTVTANFDGDSAHQAASATTSFDTTTGHQTLNTGSTQQNNNAGNSQQNNSTQP